MHIAERFNMSDLSAGSETIHRLNEQNVTLKPFKQGQAFTIDSWLIAFNHSAAGRAAVGEVSMDGPAREYS